MQRPNTEPVQTRIQPTGLIHLVSPETSNAATETNIPLMFTETVLIIQDAVRVDLAIIRIICAVVTLQPITTATELTMYQFMHMLRGIILGRVAAQLVAELAQATVMLTRIQHHRHITGAWLEDQTEEVAFIRLVF
jgi:hypothetical protein